MAEDFVNAFCDWIAPRVTPSLQNAATPFSLFAHTAVEVDDGKGNRNFTDPYTVIRQFGGPAQRSDPLQEVNLQVYTIGSKAITAFARAHAIRAAMQAKRSPDDDGNTPVRDVVLDGFVLLALDDLTQPGLLGRTENRGWVEVVFNFGVLYRAA